MSSTENTPTDTTVEELADRVATLEAQLEETRDVQTETDEQGREWSLRDLKQLGLTRREAIYALGALASGYAMREAIAASMSTAEAATNADQVGLPGERVDVYANLVDTGQEGIFGTDDGDGKEVYIPGSSIKFRGTDLANTPIVAPQVDGLGWTFQTDGDNEMRVQARRSASNTSAPYLVGRFAHEGAGDLYGFVRGYAEDDTTGAHEGRMELGAAEAGGNKVFKTVPSQSNIYQSTAQTIQSASFTQVNFDATRFDYGPSADLSNNQLTVDHAGLYTITANITYSTMADATQVQARIRVNTTDEARKVIRTGASGQVTVSVTTTLDLAAGDTIKAMTYQDSGAAQDLAAQDSTTYLIVR